jgi:hypothetical protein
MFSTLFVILYVFGTLFLVSLCLTAGRRRDPQLRYFEDAEQARALALAARHQAYVVAGTNGGFDLKGTHS